MGELFKKINEIDFEEINCNVDKNLGEIRITERNNGSYIEVKESTAGQDTLKLSYSIENSKEAKILAIIEKYMVTDDKSKLVYKEICNYKKGIRTIIDLENMRGHVASGYATFNYDIVADDKNGYKVTSDEIGILDKLYSNKHKKELELGLRIIVDSEEKGIEHDSGVRNVIEQGCNEIYFDNKGYLIANTILPVISDEQFIELRNSAEISEKSTCENSLELDV